MNHGNLAFLLLQKKKLLLLKKKKLMLKKKREQQEKKKRAYWVHPINQHRDTRGVFGSLLQELRCDNARHIMYMRMSTESFDHILSLIYGDIQKMDTNMRPAIQPALKLAVTLHHLAEGASHSSIAAHYRLGRSTVSEMIYDTCRALYKVLQPIYMRTPTGPDEWKAVADG